MANKHLSNKPHKIRKQPDAWWYEEDDGVLVVVYRNAISEGFAQIKIPWKSIRGALARKDKS